MNYANSYFMPKSKPEKWLAFFCLVALLSNGCEAQQQHEKNSIQNTKPDIIVEAPGDSTFQSQKQTDFALSLVELVSVDSNYTYQEMKAWVKQVKSGIDTNSITADSLSKLFTHLLVRKIIPYWYGTPWTFEGHTATPGQGTIACGYFISTTLRDLGINVNRYKLAQQYPINEAKTLALQNEVFEFSESTTEANIQTIRDSLETGVYFLGFDQSHTGFLYKNENGIFLIHSNYIHAQGVSAESIHNSEAFSYYNRFYIAPLSTNRQLLSSWLNDVSIAVIAD